uniref:Ubiquitin-like protein 5 n=1 Tax=Moschus moschiferus TaxID=68415 RepID=A0A8C6DKT6_MOSMO
MTEAFCKDPLGKKVCIKCNTDDNIGKLKKVMIAQTGTGRNNIVLKKWYMILKHHVSLGNNEIHNGMTLELYYQ